jgi:adenosylmethionine-8-amino-7-oxononanoate aminotransferase
MEMSGLLKIDQDNIWHPFTPLVGATNPLLITHAEGVYLHTHDGRKIIDAISSWWVNLHGHAHPEIAKAVAHQIAKLEHVIFAGFTHEPAITLSQNLLSILPSGFSKIFYSDNGSTSVEVAIKMAIQFWHNQNNSRSKIIALEGAYHGDTFGAMAVGDRGIFSKPFSSYLFDVEFIDFPEVGKEENSVNQFKKIAESGSAGIFIFEPLIQAAGGMRIYRPEVLDQLLEIAKQHDIICIADEVFTGFGRTGKMLASDYLKNKPDLIALSKGLTGGTMALGATCVSQKILTAFQNDDFSKTFFHGHSFTANPVACAASNASFSLLMEITCQQSIAQISKSHSEFAGKIKNHASLKDVRCLGTILAIELNATKTSYVNDIRKKIYTFFLQKNILMRPLGNIFYLVPPYCITDDQLKYIYSAIEEFLSIE